MWKQTSLSLFIKVAITVDDLGSHHEIVLCKTFTDGTNCTVQQVSQFIARLFVSKK